MPRRARPDSKGVSIQSVQRAAAILRELALGPRRLGVSELSDRLGLAKGTIHGLLRTLAAEGFVEQHAESGKYQLGPVLLQLGNGYLDMNDLARRSVVWADTLAAKAQESVRVAVLHARGALIVHHAFRPDNTLQMLEVGAVLPLHATALGKALLAHRPDLLADLAATDRPRLTRYTIVAPARLGRECETIRRQGFAVEREEAILSEAGIAAPVFDQRGALAGAIGITGTASALLQRRQPRPGLVALVTDAARSVSRDLGAPAYAIPSLPGAAAG